MDRRTVELRVGGQKYRVVSSAGEDELKRLAEVVSAKLSQVAPAGRMPSPQTMLLAAIALAHDAETERGRRESLEHRTSELLRRVLAGIDETLGLDKASR